MDDFVVMGLGQLGQLYGAGALRAGLRVIPLRRQDDVQARLSSVASDAPVLVAVGEDDLPGAIAALPEARRPHAVLLQNELFPARWQAAGLTAPTVAVPWVLKKKGLPVTVARTTPVYGRHAAAIASIHEALELPCEVLPDDAALGQALVSKYAFILTVNVLGLVRDEKLGEWLANPGDTLQGVVTDALALGEAKLGAEVEHEAVRSDIHEGMQALASFPAKGRTAPARLARAVADADALGLAVPTLRGIG